jgi:hypothetical protein
MTVLHEALFNCHFRFEHFLAQKYWRKCAHKILENMQKPRIASLRITRTDSTLLA